VFVVLISGREWFESFESLAKVHKWTKITTQLGTCLASPNALTCCEEHQRRLQNNWLGCTSQIKGISLLPTRYNSTSKGKMNPNN
jgi:hypothetical protein